MADFEDLKGKILTEVRGGIGDDKMVFVANDGKSYLLFYSHD